MVTQGEYILKMKLIMSRRMLWSQDHMILYAERQKNKCRVGIS